MRRLSTSTSSTFDTSVCDHDAAVMSAYRGGFLPEEPYDDWTVAIPASTRAAIVTAARRFTNSVLAGGGADQATCHRTARYRPLRRASPHAAIAANIALDRPRHPREAHTVYRQRMAELGVAAGEPGDIRLSARLEQSTAASETSVPKPNAVTSSVPDTNDLVPRMREDPSGNDVRYRSPGGREVRRRSAGSGRKPPPPLRKGSPPATLSSNIRR